MADPGAAVGSAVAGAVASSVIDFITKKDASLASAKTFAAAFDADAKRIEGSEEIKVKRWPGYTTYEGQESPKIWYYEVEASEGYTFLRVPLSPSAVREQLDWDRHAGVPIPTSFRWIESIPTHPSGTSGPPNVPVGFMIFGYKPKDLLDATLAKMPPG